MSSQSDVASLVRFLSAVQKEVACLGDKMDDKLDAKFAQQQAVLRFKALSPPQLSLFAL